MDEVELNILVAIAEASERIMVNQKVIMDVIGWGENAIITSNLRDAINATNPVLNKLRLLIP